MLASLATIMKEKTALVTSLVYFALTQYTLKIGKGGEYTKELFIDRRKTVSHFPGVPCDLLL